MQLCPYCSQEITSVTLERPKIYGTDTQWMGVAYSCPHDGCNKLLSVGIDPLSIRNDILRELRKKA